MDITRHNLEAASFALAMACRQATVVHAPATLCQCYENLYLTVRVLAALSVPDAEVDGLAGLGMSMATSAGELLASKRSERADLGLLPALDIAILGLPTA